MHLVLWSRMKPTVTSVSPLGIGGWALACAPSLDAENLRSESVAGQVGLQSLLEESASFGSQGNSTDYIIFLSWFYF